MDLAKANEIAQLLANVATFLGIPIAAVRRAARIFLVRSRPDEWPKALD